MKKHELELEELRIKLLADGAIERARLVLDICLEVAKSGMETMAEVYRICRENYPDDLDLPKQLARVVSEKNGELLEAIKGAAELDSVDTSALDNLFGLLSEVLIKVD